MHKTFVNSDFRPTLVHFISEFNIKIGMIFLHTCIWWSDVFLTKLLCQDKFNTRSTGTFFSTLNHLETRPFIAMKFIK